MIHSHKMISVSSFSSRVDPFDLHCPAVVFTKPGIPSFKMNFQNHFKRVKSPNHNCLTLTRLQTSLDPQIWHSFASNYFQEAKLTFFNIPPFTVHISWKSMHFKSCNLIGTRKLTSCISWSVSFRPSPPDIFVIVTSLALRLWRDVIFSPKLLKLH